MKITTTNMGIMQSNRLLRVFFWEVEQLAEELLQLALYEVLQALTQRFDCQDARTSGASANL